MESGDSGGSGDGAMAGGDPGFGDSVGGDLSLPSLVDEEPIYSASSSSNESGSGSSNGSSSQGASSSGRGSSATSDESTAGVSTSGEGASRGRDGSKEKMGTRAQGGLEPDWGTPETTMTKEEQVAILDKRLESSTGVFDEIIREEQRQQRSRRREQQTSDSNSSSSEQSDQAGRSPYDENSIGNAGASNTADTQSGSRNKDSQVRFEPPEDIDLSK